VTSDSDPRRVPWDNHDTHIPTAFETQDHISANRQIVEEMVRRFFEPGRSGLIVDPHKLGGGFNVGDEEFTTLTTVGHPALEGDPYKMKKVDLKSALASRGMNETGSAKALAERLHDAFSSEAFSEIPYYLRRRYVCSISHGDDQPAKNVFALVAMRSCGCSDEGAATR
jgi:hypothetical protein